MIILKIFFALTIFIESSKAQFPCNNIGDLQTFYDETCSTNPSTGCNAGGQGQNCRFCGFGSYPPCPAINKPSEKPYSTTSRTTKERVTPIYKEKLIFSDDFNTLDFNTWKHDLTLAGGGNWEFQIYHNNRTNSYVKNGIFHIVPTLTEERIGVENLKGNNYRMDMWGGSPADMCTGNNFYGCERTAGAGGSILNPIQSAKITTATSFSFRYGRVEVVAKLPQGDWLWPAIWMLPAKNEYGMWPASGEIDIMESRGNVNYPWSAEGGCDSFGSTLHWGADYSQNRYEMTHSVYHHPSKLSDDFHTYGLYWSEERLYTYIDDPNNIVLDIDLTNESFWERGNFPSYFANPWENSGKNAPFDKEYYLIINLAVGGTVGFFPDGVDGKPWSNYEPNAVNKFYAAKNNWYPTWKDNSSFEIDSVKVWSFD